VAELCLVRCGDLCVKAAIHIAILALVVASAVAADYAKWSWSSTLPQRIATGTKPAHRTAAEVDAFFRSRYRGGTIQELLSHLGRPDGFSPQAPYSKTLGTAQPCRAGGTLLFRLTDDGELHVRTDGDFHQVYDALRYDRRGKGTLLYK
jgi:hypothetical protein